MAALKDGVWADFSRRAGIRSMREWEEAHEAFEAAAAGEARELAQRVRAGGRAKGLRAGGGPCAPGPTELVL